MLFVCTNVIIWYVPVIRFLHTMHISFIDKFFLNFFNLVKIFTYDILYNIVPVPFIISVTNLHLNNNPKWFPLVEEY